MAFFRNGSITVGGQRLHDLDLKWWRSQIGLVQQEPFLFNDTIFNNVANGLIGTEWENDTEAKKRQLVEVACREAYADEFILRLPEVSDMVSHFPLFPVGVALYQRPRSPTNVYPDLRKAEPRTPKA